MSAAIGNKRKRRVSSTNITLNNLSNDILCSVADYLPKTSRVLLAVAFTAPSSSWKKYQWKGKPSTSSKAIISSVKDDTPCKSLMADLLSELDVEMNRRELRERNSYRNYKPEVKKFRNDDLKKVIKSGLDQQMSTYYDGGWEILDFVDVPKSLAARLTDDDLAAILVCIDAKNNLKRLNLTHCFSIVGQGLETLRGSTVLEKLDLGLVRQMEVPQLFTDAQISGEVVYDILNGYFRSGR